MNLKKIEKLNNIEDGGKRAKAFKKIYGFDPRLVGLRPRGYWIVARDGRDEPDYNAGSYGNYIGTKQDNFDCTYRYYFYEPIKELEEK